MKPQLNHRSLVFTGVTIILLFFAGVSCKKMQSEPITLATDTVWPGYRFGNEIFTTTLKEKLETDGLVVFCNNGEEILLLEKSKGDPLSTTGIKCADIAFTDFGMVLHDRETKKLWSFIKNDDQS